MVVKSNLSRLSGAFSRVVQGWTLCSLEQEMLLLQTGIFKEYRGQDQAMQSHRTMDATYSGL
jgi:hypothetical protein